MPLSATAHLSSSIVFLALIILCLLLSPSFPSHSLHCSTSVCSLLQPWHLVQYITHSRLSTLNSWLLDYTFLDFYAIISSEWIPQEWDYSAQRTFVPKISRHPAWPMHKKSSLCSLPVPSNNPLPLPPCRSAPEMKRVLFPLTSFSQWYSNESCALCQHLRLLLSSKMLRKINDGGEVPASTALRARPFCSYRSRGLGSPSSWNFQQHSYPVLGFCYLK